MVPLQLLVIDDSSTVRKHVELSFRGTPATVSFAASGEEGVTKAAATQPDLILLDLVLPDMRGIDVCERLSESADTADIPIVLMSAQDVSVLEAFRGYASVVEFVGKPFSSDDVVERVEAAHRRRGRGMTSGVWPTQAALRAAAGDR
jgi:two-component system OmpR family response regulator